MQLESRYYCKKCRLCYLFIEVRAENEENLNINDELEPTEKPTEAIRPGQFMQHADKPHCTVYYAPLIAY